MRLGPIASRFATIGIIAALCLLFILWAEMAPLASLQPL